MPSWSVVTTAKERPEYVRAFVAWHLGEGAERITLYYDDPEDPGFGQFSHLPQIDEVRCDDTFWQQCGGNRPAGIGKRQSANATRTYRACGSVWLLHCDIDEFADSGETAMSGLLDTVPPDAGVARLRPIERMYLAGEETRAYSDTFRHRTPEHSPRWLAKIYRNPEQIQFGIRGHRTGKLFHRCGIPQYTVRSHDSIENGTVIDTSSVRHFEFPPETARLLHLFIFDYAHFLHKGEWKFARRPWRKARDASGVALTTAEHRRMKIGEIFESGTPQEIRALFDDIFVFSPRRLKKLARFQQIDEHY